MKKFFILLLTLAVVFPVFAVSSVAETASFPTETSVSDWQALGNVTLYCDNGHGYAQRVGQARLYMNNEQGNISYRVVRLDAEGKESNEVYFVAKLVNPWYPQGSVSGQSNPPSYNAMAGDFYLNI